MLGMLGLETLSVVDQWLRLLGNIISLGRCLFSIGSTMVKCGLTRV